MAIIMANDHSSTLGGNALAEEADDFSEPFAKRPRLPPHLIGTVIFLLPCAGMSALRRKLLLPGILKDGGVVTMDPRAATHCVVAIPLASDASTQLLNKFGVSSSCKLVKESFLFQ